MGGVISLVHLKMQMFKIAVVDLTFAGSPNSEKNQNQQSTLKLGRDLFDWSCAVKNT